MLNGQATVTGYSESNFALSALQDSRRKSEWAQRRDEAILVRCVIEGKIDRYVIEKLKSRFHPNTFGKLLLDQGVDSIHEILKDVVEKIAVGWSNGATYQLLDEEKTPIESPEFEAFMDAFDLDSLMSDVEFKVWVYRKLFVQPTVCVNQMTGLREISWRVHTPETFDLIKDPNNPLGYLGVILYDTITEIDPRTKRATERLRATVINRKEWRQLVEYEVDKWKEIDAGVNDYGVMPGVIVERKRSFDSLWGESHGLRLANMTVSANSWETYKGLLASSFLKVIVGPFDDTFPSGQYVRQAGVITTGGQAAPALMDFSTDLQAFDASQIAAPIARASVAMGLSADEFGQGKAPSSGYELQLRYWNRDGGARRLAKRLKKSCRQIYELAWWIIHVEMSRAGLPPLDGITALPPGRKLDGSSTGPATVTFACEPNPIDYPETAADESTRRQMDLDAGLTNLALEMMRKSPDLSQDEAFAAVKENRRINAQLQSRSSAAMAALMRGPGAPPPGAPGAPPAAAEQTTADAGQAGQPPTAATPDAASAFSGREVPAK